MLEGCLVEGRTAPSRTPCSKSDDAVSALAKRTTNSFGRIEGNSRTFCALNWGADKRHQRGHLRVPPQYRAIVINRPRSPASHADWRNAAFINYVQTRLLKGLTHGEDVRRAARVTCVIAGRTPHQHDNVPLPPPSSFEIFSAVT